MIDSRQYLKDMQDACDSSGVTEQEKMKLMGSLIVNSSHDIARAKMCIHWFKTKDRLEQPE